MSSLSKPAQSPEAGYWRSLAQLDGVQDPNLGAEFLPDQLEPMDEPSRRRFLQIMGASVAMAGAVGCSKQHRHVVPAVHPVVGRTIGQLQPFATAMEIAGVAYGLLAQSYEGRPIRLDGNPKHPTNNGAVSPWTVASILGLYDPDRSKKVYLRPSPKTLASESSWKEFAIAAKQMLADGQKNQGEGLRILSGAVSSPSLQAARTSLFKTLPKAKWIEYEPVNRDNERLGTKQAFGQPLRVLYDLSQAEVIVDLDADLLGLHPAAMQHTHAFAGMRKPEAVIDPSKQAGYNRLYCIESQFSTTGASADHRLALRSSDVAAFVNALSALIAKAGDAKPLASAKAQKFVEALAKDLERTKGKCVLAVGFRQPPEVHAAVQRLNHHLGNAGKTVNYVAAPEGDRPSSVQEVVDLAKEMNDGKVETLLILGSNPVYTAPADCQFAAGLKKVKASVHLGLYRNETGQGSTWHVPSAHYLEKWGDARAWDGTLSIVQPLIEPLYECKSALEVLAIVSGHLSVEEKAHAEHAETAPQPTAAAPQPTDFAYKVVRDNFKTLFGEDTEAKWKKSLQDGVVAGSAWKAAAVTPAGESKPLPVSEDGALEAVFIPDAKVFDGRFSNNAWLQELPDFITKLVWDNAILLSLTTAKKLGVGNGQMVNASLGKGTPVKAGVYIQPGHADESATLLLGYGRRAAGVVGGSAIGVVDTVGFDFYPLRSSSAMGFSGGLKLEPLNEWYTFVSTQLHSLIDTTGLREREKRADTLVRSDTLENFKKDPKAVQEKVHELPMVKLFENPLKQSEKNNYKWGMAIDMSVCTGCNACVLACQSENNIPVVGKYQVSVRREMHWLRIDRYFHGDTEHLENVEVLHQPMMCVHCENAPCEQVCPVAATLHSEEGTNDMVYNRCIGTRYCANNCPYKVRRFNFLNWHKQLNDEKNESIRLMFNPDVTVRARGVMEKCTYCIQRIRGAKIKAKNAGKTVVDGDIVTACQQACPAGAITFGDLNDHASRVTKLHESPRSYKMLMDLNTSPRTNFLGRIRNPNPELENGTGAKEAGHGHA
jgi:molybdopterin-containing oxidoreductase family iron-sulfur binding subunit